jgi:hypothetical protein
MSTPEQPDTPPLTRKQLRNLRNTGATPVITPDAADAASETESAAEQAAAVAPSAAPLPRAADPVVVAAPPVADSAVDLGASPLTRRQARQQERIRTASVPVITPEVAAAHAAATGAIAADDAGDQDAPAEPATPTAAMRDLFGIAPSGGDAEDDESADRDDSLEQDDTVDEQDDADDHGGAETDEPEAFVPDFDDDGDEEDVDELHEVADDDLTAEPVEAEVEQERAVVNPIFGSAVVVEEASSLDLPTSFDQLLARGTTGSHGTSNALIMTPSTGGSAIVAPITATGEVLITGTLNLPEGLGSTGHAPGTADGKEIDAVLLDGELPAHSSPTPIAASAAISTVKTNGDVIKPPAPEKGSKLMMTLAITAGVLALALVGVLILAFVTGVL